MKRLLFQWLWKPSRVTVGVQDKAIYFLLLNFSTIFSVNKIEVHYLIALDFKILKRVTMLLDLTIKQNPRAPEGPACRNLSRVTELMSNIYTDFYHHTTRMTIAC